jgi:RHS repeat-associated protein
MSQESSNINTNDQEEESRILILRTNIQSTIITEEQRYEFIIEYVGLTLEENQGKAITYDDLQSQIKDELGIENIEFINEALEIFKNQKAQYNTEGSQSSKHNAADPVMMFNGQFVLTTPDIKINGAGIDFTFIRTYKNQTYYNGPLGFNWDHNYNLWLREEGNSIVRSSGELREDRYMKHEIFNYYVPPDGYHDVIEKNGNSFVLTTASGVKYIYEQINAGTLHRIQRIEDKNSNYLLFEYYDNNNGQLKNIYINNYPNRKVEFYYNRENKIDSIKTYEVSYEQEKGDIRKVIRTWHYNYDDHSDLIAMTTPSTIDYLEGNTTSYEYSSPYFTGSLMHNLLRIVDAEGQLYLENEYGSQKGLLSYNRVTRQRQGNGEYHFDYANVIPEQSWDYTPEQIPSFITILYQRNGHPVEYIYNKFGNLIVKREKVLQDCFIKEYVYRYIYNKDGILTGSLSPEGNLVHNYYGRDDFYLRPFNHGNQDLDPWKDPNLTKEERLKFGNLLAVVRRGEYYNTFLLNFNNLYVPFPKNIIQIPFKSEDIITKYTYESNYQQIVSSSDPRYTKSADPRDNKDTNYNKHLTIYEYSKPTAKNLISIKYPDTTFPSSLPDGKSGITNVKEEYLQYDNKGRLEKFKSSSGSITEYQYFKEISGPREGYLHRIIQDVGIGVDKNITTEYGVNEVGQITSIKNPKGFSTKLRVNELDQTIETILPDSKTHVENFFNRNNLLIRTKRDYIYTHEEEFKRNPQIRTYKYDTQNNILKETIGGKDLSSHHVIQHIYDASDKKIKTILPESNSINFEYEERLLNNLIIKGVCTSEAIITKTMYDGNGRKIADIDGRNNLTYYKYDTSDRLISTTDSLGNVKQFSYDKLGNITTEGFFEKKSTSNEYYLLSRKSYNYDERGNRRLETLYLFKNDIFTHNLSDPDKEFEIAQSNGLIENITTQFFYDENKLLFRSLNTKGQESLYEYDGIGRKIRETDNLKNYIKTKYDKNSNIIRIDRHEIVPQTSDPIVKEEVFSTINDFDKLDRKIVTIDNLGNKTEYYYDMLNSLVLVKDALNNIKTFEYDIFSRKIKETIQMTETGLGGSRPLYNIQTQYLYDNNNNLISIIDSNGAETSYKYDVLDRLKVIVYHDQSFKEFAYDANNNLITVKDNNGLKTFHSYDSLNRKIHTFIDKTTTTSSYPYPLEAEDFEEYEYDGLGRVKFQKNNFSILQLQYDSLSRIYKEEIKILNNSFLPSTSKVYVLNRSFDSLSNITNIIYPSGREISYSYNGINQLVQILNRNKGSGYPGSATFPSRYEIIKYEYNGLRLSKALYGNKCSYQLFYDGLARTISVLHNRRGRRRLLEIQQLYDAVGNKRLERNILPRDIKTETYKYDSYYRLTKFEYDDHVPSINLDDLKPSSRPLGLSELNGQNKIDNIIGSLSQNPLDYAYKYDKLGNRIEEISTNGNHITYTSNLLNQYMNRNNQSFLYDLNGNMIYEGNKRYFYNYRNQLIKVSNNTGKTLLTIFYDATGNCIAHKDSDSKVKYLINDKSDVIEEYNKNTKLLAQYINGYANQKCQIVTNSEEYWYHNDIIQSTRLLSNSNGKIPSKFRYDYDPFGKIITSTSDLSTKGNSFLFVGKRFLESIELYDSYARIYSSIIGRFLQRDPNGYQDDYNLYTYAGNNPLNFIDPMGAEKSNINENEDNLNNIVSMKSLAIKKESHANACTMGDCNWSQTSGSQNNSAIKEFESQASAAAEMGKWLLMDSPMAKLEKAGFLTFTYPFMVIGAGTITEITLAIPRATGLVDLGVLQEWGSTYKILHNTLLEIGDALLSPHNTKENPSSTDTKMK